MTELGSKVNNLRIMARLVRDYDYKEISRMLRDAADTIESLRDSLNEVADKWAEAQIKAEDYERENMLLKRDNDTRWHELFGTPERAARTLQPDSMSCKYCLLRDYCKDAICLIDDYDALLEWLRGDE